MTDNVLQLSEATNACMKPHILVIVCTYHVLSNWQYNM